MTVHTVKPGEHLAKIAHRYGFSSWKTLYEHPDNAGLKKLRPNPDLLYPGDEVHIPELEEHRKDVEKSTGSRHVFKAKLPKKVLKLKLIGPDGTPMKNADYVLLAAGKPIEGKTSGDGTLEERIPTHTDAATLRVGDVEWTLRVGGLNPMKDAEDDGVTGAQARLKNLGYYHGRIDGVPGPLTRVAIRVFQRTWRLEPTGELDEKTRAKLVDKHGG